MKGLLKYWWVPFIFFLFFVTLEVLDLWYRAQKYFDSLGNMPREQAYVSVRAKIQSMGNDAGILGVSWDDKLVEATLDSYLDNWNGYSPVLSFYYERLKPLHDKKPVTIGVVLVNGGILVVKELSGEA